MSPTMKVQLIHNPASRTHKEARLDKLHRAFEACGAEVIVGQTALDNSMQIAMGVDLICVSGGDGALQLVVSALVQSDHDIPICVFPAGTVNLIAREIGYADEPEQFAIEVMGGFSSSEGSELKAPIAEADGVPFVACISAGPDGIAVARHSPKLKRRIGGLAYAWSAIKLMARWPKEKYTLTINATDGSEAFVSCEAFYAIKAHYFAGPWSIAPHISLDSNLFSVVALTKASRWAFVKFVTGLALHRDPARFKFTEAFDCRSLSIEDSGTPESPGAFQMDGDPMDNPPAKIRITDKTIRYCLPKWD